jgi:hypothetical protein
MRLFSLLHLLGQASLRMEQALWPEDYERMTRRLRKPCGKPPTPTPDRTHEEVMQAMQERIDRARASHVDWAMRISTQDQNLELQREALSKAGCKKVFEDKVSGTRANSAWLGKTLNAAEGDTLVVWKLDRLGRSVKQLVDLVGDLHKHGVQFRASPTPSTPAHHPGGSSSTSWQPCRNGARADRRALPAPGWKWHCCK